MKRRNSDVMKYKYLYQNFSMKYLYVIGVCLFLNMSLKAQITMQTNLLPEMPVNGTLEFEVRILKGAVANFSKYQMEVPDGFVISEIDNHGGTFSFEENKVKVIWALTPEEAEIKLKMQAKTPAATGSYSFFQKYFYLDNGEKKELEVTPFAFQLKEEPAKIEPAWMTLKQYIPGEAPATGTVDPASLDPQNPEELRMHARQLKKDSKEALKVGDHEVKKAKLKIQEADKELKTAALISNEAERSKALAKANKNKEAAETDLAVANKILLLAKSLEDNANEIERLNNDISTKSNSDSLALAAKVASDADLKRSQEEIERLKAEFENQPEETTDNSNASEVSDAVVFRIQVGAFGTKPLKAPYNSLGKVSIVNESGMYKVLVGSFSSKEEALQKRSQVIEKGFDAFIVTYKNGQRLR